MQTKKTHWASVLILIVFSLAIFVFLLIAFGSAIASMIDLFGKTGDPAGKMIAAFTFTFETMVLLFCSWFVLQKTMGREQADLPFIFPFASWQIFAIIGTVTLAVVIGGVIAVTEITWLAWIVLPALTLLVIIPPLWLLFGIGTKGIELGLTLARLWHHWFKYDHWPVDHDRSGNRYSSGNHHRWRSHYCHTAACPLSGTDSGS